MSKFTQMIKRLSNRSARPGTVSATNWSAILGVIILVLGIGYIVQVHRSATRSFTVHALAEKQQALVEQRRTLELQQAELSALGNLERAPIVTELVATTSAEYLRPSTADVARR